MANVINTLFPPVVASFMPAFRCAKDNPRIYFNYSAFSTGDDPVLLQISVVNQKNNQNALKTSSGVLFYSIKEQSRANDLSVHFDKSREMHYIEIPVSLMKDELFLPNQFYKIQMRLDRTSKEEYENFVGKSFYDNFIKIYSTNSEDNQVDAESALNKDKIKYLTYGINHGNFSEWSTVCLIKGIDEPKIFLQLFDRGANSEDVGFSLGMIPISGRVRFYDKDGNLLDQSSERLQQYTIQVYDGENKILSSDTLYPIRENEIQYNIESQNFIKENDFGKRFKLVVHITTNNLFETLKEYYFSVADIDFEEDFDPYDPTQENKDGNIYLHFDKNKGIAWFKLAQKISGAPLQGNLHIKRASSKSNFTDWETLEIIPLRQYPEGFDLLIQDNTIGSYIGYEYSYQYENLSGVYGKAKKVVYSKKKNSTSLFCPEIEFASLLRRDKQLNLLYNCSISSFKETVGRSKVDTLGGKYPRFFENANLKYKEFSISGTITSEADVFQLFASKKDLLSSSNGKYYASYMEYLSEHNIVERIRNDIDSSSFEDIATTTENDWWWEREFREKALEWLNDGEPKLFRSLTEGLIPVVLMNVSLSPQNQLGRRIYNFSATAYQVGEGDSLQELRSLGIIARTKKDEAGTETSNDDNLNSVAKKKVAQIYLWTPTKDNVDAVDLLMQKEKEKISSLSGFNQDISSIISNARIRNIRISYDTKPHYFFFSEDYKTGVHYIEGKKDINGNVIFPTSAEEVSLTPAGKIRYSEGYIQQGYKTQCSFIGKGGVSKSTDIFINKKGKYIVPNEILVDGLVFDNTTSDVVTVDCILEYEQNYLTKTDTIKSVGVSRQVVGQESGVFEPNLFLGYQIKKKYGYKTEEFEEFMSQWKGISIEAEPYTCFKIKQNNMEKEFVVGFTGKFNLIDSFDMQDVAFCGKKMFISSIPGSWRENCFNLVKTKDIDALTHGEVVQVKDTNGNVAYKIGYNGSVFDFDYNPSDKFGIARVPVRGLFNYYGDVVKYTFN